MTEETLFLTVRELSEKIRARQISPVELTEQYLARSRQLGPRYHAYVTLTEELARKQARQAEQEIRAGRYRGPLHGIPYAAKDLVAVPGYPTTWGAKPYAQRVLNQTAAVIERLNRAGAILIGKAAMIELAGGLGYRTPGASFTGAARNPWNLDHWTCGSSSGSGAIVAAALAAFALGSETNGSILCPSASCGIAGLRPTYGRVSRYGAMALAYTMDKLGPMARSAEDLGLILEALAGHDPRDPGSLPAGQAEFRAATVRARLARPLRLGWLSQPWRYQNDEVAQAVRAAVEVLRRSGAHIEETDLPTGPWEEIASVTIGAESATAFEDLIESGQVAELADAADRIGGYVRQQITAADYLRAQRARRILQQKMAALFDRYDALVAPTTGGTAPPLHPPEAQRPRQRPAREPGRSSPTTVGNLCGLPAVSVPCGFNAQGLPIGIQFLGPPLGEDVVLAAAVLYQQQTSWHRRHPPAPELS